MSYADNVVEVDGVEMKIRDVPDPFLRAMWGYGHFAVEIAQRPVITVPGRTWPYTPETCLTDDYTFKCEWLDEQTMVCPGCGLDCT
jgi:hypothetical protein